MVLKLEPSLLRGEITPPPSKSLSHRAVLAAALAAGESRVAPLDMSQDIRVTLEAVQTLGAGYDRERDVIAGMGGKAARRAALPRIDCGESGSSLRFLIPVALALCGGGVFSGRGRLMERPQEPYFALFREKGIAYQKEGDRLAVEGTLPPGAYHLPGDVSSQFVTGLLYALPLLPGDSEIIVTTPLQSKDYVAMTLDVLSAFGVTVRQENMQHFWIPGRQTYKAARWHVEPDLSQAAFFAVARALGNPVTILGINPDSRQGDGVVFSLMERFSGTETLDIDVSQCPDLVPALALAAALREGNAVTVLSNAMRLRAKESDRLASATRQLNALGADVKEGPDFLEIRGVSRLLGGRVDSENDHRIAMTLAIAATASAGDVVLSGAESVQKSYPGFWAEYQRLGGRITVLEP